MSAQANKQRVIDAVAAFNNGDIDGYVAIYAPDAVVHGLPAEFGSTPQGHRDFLESMTHALRDFKLTHANLVAEGDLVAAHVLYSGVHDGMFHGVRPTGKKLEWTAMVFRRFNADGLTVERWMVSDNMSVMHQLGLV